VVEGPNVLAEAVASGVPIEAVFLGHGAPEDVARLARTSCSRVHELGPGVLERVAGTVTPQPVLAVLPYLDVPLDEVLGASFLVVCVDVRDPGNAGTILRSAEASGADGVICCAGSVDVYNPKTVRASAGALFHVPVVAAGDAGAVLDRVGERETRRLSAVPHGGRTYTEADLRGRVAIVLGNEAVGLPAGVLPHVDELVTIPMAGRSESLNVGMAAAVLCFEVARQRRTTAARKAAG